MEHLFGTDRRFRDGILYQTDKITNLSAVDDKLITILMSFCALAASAFAWS